MSRKYIKIRQLHARMPFRQCVIQFVVRKQEQDPVSVSEIQFYAQAISYTLEENIQLLYSQKHLNSLAVYLMAVNPQNRVANIGFVPLNLCENFTDRKEKLQGLSEQTGFIVFSMQDEPFARMSHLVNVNVSSNSAHSISGREPTQSQVFKGNVEVERSEFEQEDEQQEKLKESKVEEYKNDGKEMEMERTLQRANKNHQLSRFRLQDSPIKTLLTQEQPSLKQKQFPQQIIPKSDLAQQLEQIENTGNHIYPALPLSEHEQLQAFIIELLKHKLKNSQYCETIQQNSIFLEQQTARLSTLLLKTAPN